MNNYCVCCGRTIPENEKVCQICDEQMQKWHIPLDLFEENEDESGEEQ